jgi:glycosyltransferase involved in cell wall biosynthesis
MKILMVNKYLYEKGGADKYAIELGTALKDTGHDVQFFGTRNKNNVVGNKDDILVNDFEESKIIAPSALIYSRDAKKKMVQLLKAFKPDVAHFNNISYHLTTSIIDACQSLSIPSVMTIHDPQLVCPNHMLYHDGQVCCDCLKQHNFKPCLEHRCIKGSFLKSYLGYKESNFVHKRGTYNLISRFICPSCFIQKALIDGGYQESKTTFMRNFSNMSVAKSVPAKKDYILFFGRLSPEKGLDTLLAALPNDVKLIIAGQGPLSLKLEHNEHSNISFVGYKTGDELRKLIQEARFSVYPSRWYENCPLSVFESISCCTPVIGSNLGGIPELIDDGKTGLLFDANNPTDLKTKIENLYHNERLLNDMYNNCLAFKKVPTINEYTESMINLYKEVIHD